MLPNVEKMQRLFSIFWMFIQFWGSQRGVRLCMLAETPLRFCILLWRWCSTNCRCCSITIYEFKHLMSDLWFWRRWLWRLTWRRAVRYNYRHFGGACCLLQVLPKQVNLWLSRLVAGLLPWRRRFDPRPVHVGFVVDKVATVQVFLRVTAAFPCHDSTDTPCSSIRHRRYVISVISSVIKYHTASHFRKPIFIRFN